MTAAAGPLHETILNRMPDGFVELDPHGVVLFANQGVERILGRGRDEIVGRPIDETFPPSVLVPMRAAYTEAAGRAGAEGGRVDFEAHYEPTDVWLRVSVTPGESGTSVFFRDVSDRRRTADVAREAEAKYQKLVERLPLVVYVDSLDQAGSNLYTSPQTTEMLGYTPEEWTDDPDLFLKILHPDDRERVAADLRAVNATGAAGHDEYRLVAKDGRIVWVRDDSVVIRDEDGRPLFRQGYLLDLTERLETERALVEAEQRYRTIVEQSPLGIYRNDAEGRLIYVSTQVETITGRRASEFVADPDLFWRMVHPDDAERVRVESARAVAANEPFGLEYRLVRQDGSIVWILDRTAPVFDDAGRVLYRQGFVADVTAEEERAEALAVSEARFRSAFEGASIGITVLDLDGRYLDANPAFCAMVGRSRDELLTLGFADVTHPEDVPRDVESERAMIADTSGALAYEKRYVRPDGTLVFALVSISLVRGPDGRPLHFITQAQDVTEQRRLEEELRQSQKMEAVGRLAGGVAHDFNNVLTAISGYADFIVARHAPGERDHDDAEQIRRSAQRAAELTAQLLAFSRRQVLQPRVFALDEAVGDLEDMLRRLLGEHLDIRLELEAPEARVRADRGQIDQVVLNLAVNARDAMPDGGSLTIATALEDIAAPRGELAAGRYAVLTVADTGVGMDAATAARVFEPFFTTKPVGEGTGLGLATVYGTVKQSGGDVVLETRPGAGTTFRVYLPLAKAPAEAPRSAPPSAPVDGSETILLAEDEDVVRALVAEVLTGRGYRVLEAGHPNEALELSRSHAGPIHLLVTDVVMPGMSGRALAERLTAERAELRVLYTSGYTNGRIGPTADLADAAFIQKPFATGAIAEKVREVLDAARAEAA